MFSVKGLIGNVLDFASHTASVTTAQLPMQCDDSHRQEQRDVLGTSKTLLKNVAIRLDLATRPTATVC